MNPQQFLNDLLRSSGLNAGPNITGSYTPEESLGGGRVTTGQGTTEAGASSPLNGDPRRQQNKNSRVTSGGGGRNSGGGSGRVTSGGGNVSPGGAGRNLLMSRGNLMRGAFALPTAGLVAADIAQGRTLDAAGTAVGGAATLAATEALARGVGGGKYGAAIRGIGALAAPAIGNLLGNTLEGKRAEDTGVAPAAASEVEEVKAGRSKQKIDAQQQLEIRVNELNAQLAGMKDIYGAMSDQQFTNMQREMPMIQKALDNQMVRQQALMNTQTSNYAMLGTLSTAGKLATGAQAQTGETMRTMLRNNPYSGSVMQAPNISF